MSEVSARVVLDSISRYGNRLTTLEVTFHRFVLAEFNTHRVFSRNSASSRAIPVQKQLDRLRQSPAIPVQFGTNQPGMQAGPPLEGDDLDAAIAAWLEARDDALWHAKRLMDMGVHKQVANRLLEPFMWHTVIVTATDWDGFWNQRVSTLAQPEIDAAARAMLIAYEASEPELLERGEWHTPYILPEEYEYLKVDYRKAVSAARCARVSYLTHDGVRDLAKDLELYRRLASADPKHASPFEHVATPVPNSEAHSVRGNFHGWRQFRHEIEAAA